MKRTADIHTILKPLSVQPTQCYLSSALQVADVLEWLLQQLGPSEIWLTSFSISEEFLRRIFFMAKKYDMRRFHVVLDHKATNKTIKLWLLISNVVATTFLADNHSKVLLIRGDAGGRAMVVTSQNLTRGNRKEAAMLTSDPVLFDQMLAEVQSMIDTESVPLSELLSELLCNTPTTNSAT